MLMRLLRNAALALGLGLVLTCCSGVNPPMHRFPELTFTSSPPFQLDIGRVEVVSQYQAPAQAPHLEYDMPVSPENALKRWVQDRLKPIGRSGIMRVVIRNASAIETPLKTETGVKSVFEKQQVARVDMAVDVAIQILDERQFVKAEVTGKVERSRTEPEGMKLNERDKLLYDMVSELMQAFNAEVDPQIRNTFGPWLGAM